MTCEHHFVLTITVFVNTQWVNTLIGYRFLIIITSIQKDALNWSESDSKYIYNVTNDFYFK